MAYTAHIDFTTDAPNADFYAVTVRRDGRAFEAIGILDASLEQPALFDAAAALLCANGWRPDGDPVFFWGTPDGNLFDGPWRARAERNPHR